jgi:hypothetical protein
MEFNRFGNSRKANIESNVTTPSRFGHSKQLLNSPELKALTGADNALRIWLDRPNRCWKLSKGMRCIPLAQADEVWEKCQNYMQVERPALVAKCGEAYLAQVAEAQRELGPDHFNPKDYPTVEVFLREFDMDFNIMSFNVPENLQVASPKVYAAAAAKNSETMKVAAEEIQTAQRVLFQAYVDELINTLAPSDGKKKKLNKAKIEKLQEFITGFNFRNVANDDELKGEVEKLRALMEGIDVDMVKSNDRLKADMIEAFRQASGTMNAMAEVRGRKIRAV